MDTVWVQGKGEKLRQVPYTTMTARALDRYIRMRDRREDSTRPEMWLGERGPLGKTGVEQMLRRRAKRLGLGHIFPHMFRHTAADRLLSAGMDEGSAMEILGWSRGSRSMLDRYGRAVSHRRAIESYRRLLG
jgi:integrase